MKKYLLGFLGGMVLTLAATVLIYELVIKDNDLNAVTPSQIVDLPDTTQEDEFAFTEEDNAKFKEIAELIEENYLYEYDVNQIKEGMFAGMLAMLQDPYTGYYTVEDFTSLLEGNEGTYVGIGVRVSQDVETNKITVVKNFKGSPAIDAGLQPGDQIIKVEGEDITGMELTFVVSKIKGGEGTPVNITIYRESEDKEIELNIMRKLVTMDTVEFEMLEDNIGYILIEEFDEVTINQFKDALKSLEKQGQEKMIIDLRNNPGGSLSAVCEMIDMLVPEGVIVYTLDKDGNRQEERSDAKEFNKPIVILTNEYSASASELFTGALRDYDKAEVVGTTTYGKGVVQRIYGLEDGSGAKLTVSKYYTPSGYDIHGVGIVPDYEIELSEEASGMSDIPLELDNQLQKAIELLE
ncbi:MAG: hypothetical protein K0R15_1283 [Clostridiales bacterium]|jgi:carboxyl-terminal processing protease|nr:hypothetical protein [Clostridiales bacterium]